VLIGSAEALSAMARDEPLKYEKMFEDLGIDLVITAGSLNCGMLRCPSAVEVRPPAASAPDRGSARHNRPSLTGSICADFVSSLRRHSPLSQIAKGRGGKGASGEISQPLAEPNIRLRVWDIRFGLRNKRVAHL